MSAPHIFDSEILARRSARALRRSDVPDYLLLRTVDELIDRLALIRRDFSSAVVIGDAGGRVLARLAANRPSISWIGVEIAARPETPLSRHPLVVAHADALPFRDDAFDLAVSVLSLQLVNDLPGALLQIRRSLKADGLFLGAVLGGETLKELREAWLVAEDEVCGGSSPRVAPFADVRDLGQLLQRAGFALPVADRDVVTVTYATPLDLMLDLKHMGASNMLAARRRVPVTRRLLQRAAEVYCDRFATDAGRIAATFEIITLTAWTPHESQQKPLKPGSATTRLADALAAHADMRADKRR